MTLCELHEILGIGSGTLSKEDLNYEIKVNKFNTVEEHLEYMCRDDIDRELKLTTGGDEVNVTDNL